jgi:hypothetical protein
LIEKQVLRKDYGSWIVHNEVPLDLYRLSVVGIGKSIRIQMAKCIILMKEHLKYIQSLGKQPLGK